MMCDDKVTVRTRWCVVIVMMVTLMTEVCSISGSNMCMVKQKYNITKRVKYRAPMAVRTYEWCFAVPPRCSKWTTEMRDLTKLETEERTAEVAVCCPGYKMRDGSCVTICPFGKTGTDCADDCPPKKWGPNCVKDCKECEHGFCSPVTGDCFCEKGWQGERCETIIATTTTMSVTEEVLTTNKSTPKLSAELPTKPTTSASTTRKPLLTSTHRSLSTTETISTQPTIVYTTENFTTPVLATTTKRYENSTLTVGTKLNVLITTTTNLPSTTTDLATTYKVVNTQAQSKINLATTASIEENTKMINHIQNQYNRTEEPITETTEAPKITTKLDKINDKTTTFLYAPNATKATDKGNPVIVILAKDNFSTKQSTRKAELTVPTATTMKSKPKEIWIKPAQKGEPSTIIDIKNKQILETSQHRLRTPNRKESSTMTTPRTIIVSIIPTSVSYSSFKKISLSTTSYVPVRSQFQSKDTNKSIDFVANKSMAPTSTITTFTTIAKKMGTTLSSWNTSSTINHIKPPTNKPTTIAPPTREPHSKTTKLLPIRNNTNSMLKVVNTLKISELTTASTIASDVPAFTKDLFKSKSINVTNQQLSPTQQMVTTTEKITSTHLTISANKTKSFDSTTNNPITELPVNKLTITRNESATDETKKNVDDNENSKIVTENPIDSEEPFNILTEPEHITAVMGEKEKERSSADLISVLGIAGGVMMAVITLASLIVMMERCRRPRYEDIRKMNEMRMQVYLDENDVAPPPYVRSIFHTPLPDLPTSEKCHYQPISTLDRNVKQFMRPVVVQTISPIMLENFRGILECHYDHLPLRNTLHHDRIAPSVETCENYDDLQNRSLAESTIEALKCEARSESIDSTTSEPLYAEIPCWRPPSEHAIEIVNLNGEAMTEL